jgi:O-antigen/teichoic acid export membrane protein
MIIYMIASVIAVFVAPLSPAMLAIGKPKTFLWSLIVSTLIYFLLLPTLISKYTLSGASIAYVIFYIVYSAVMLQRLSAYIRLKTNGER